MQRYKIVHRTDNMMHEPEVVEAIKAPSSSQLPTSQHSWQCCMGPPLLGIYCGTWDSLLYILQLAMLLGS